MPPLMWSPTWQCISQNPARGAGRERAAEPSLNGGCQCKVARLPLSPAAAVQCGPSTAQRTCVLRVEHHAVRVACQHGQLVSPVAVAAQLRGGGGREGKASRWETGGAETHTELYARTQL